MKHTSQSKFLCLHLILMVVRHLGYENDPKKYEKFFHALLIKLKTTRMPKLKFPGKTFISIYLFTIEETSKVTWHHLNPLRLDTI